MKVRDSGMPDVVMWNSFFDVEKILSELEINEEISKLVEIGSGYGTFTIPSAKKIKGMVYAFDIEKEMIVYLNQQLKNHNIKNIIAESKDILEMSTGLEKDFADYMMLFNILHYEKPEIFFNEAYRILKTNGKIGIIHWRSDIPTPRGPELSIRPKPEDIAGYIDNNKFQIIKGPIILEPYHYGLVLLKI